MTLIHEIPVRSFAVSVVVIKQAKDGYNVLLLRRTRSLAGEWCQIAGSIEADETAWQTALREVKEETDLTLERLYSADICEQFYEADRNSISLLPVFVGYANPQDVVTLNAEHSEYRWVSFEEASRMVPFSGQRKVLHEIKCEFVDREPNPWLLIDQNSRDGGAR